MKSIVLLCLIVVTAAAFTRYTALVAEEETALAQLTREIETFAPAPDPDPDPVLDPVVNAPGSPEPVSVNHAAVSTQREVNAMAISHTHEMLQLLERKLDYLEMQRDDYVTCAPALGKVVRLSFSLDPPIEGLDPVSVVTSKQAYSIFGQLESEGGKFAVAAGGDIRLIGARQTLLKLDFDVSVEMRRVADGNKGGRSNGQGSTIIGLGQKQELLTVGGSKLMVEAKEVIVEEVRSAKAE